MAQTKTTYDTFTAIAEPKRRELLELLAGNEMSVSEVVDLTQWNQPMVSKHLSVLKQVGLVSEKKEGRHRVYKVNANNLQPIQIWVAQFEKHWSKQLDHLDDYLQNIQAQTIQEQSIQEQSIQEQSIQEQSIQEQSIQAKDTQLKGTEDE